MKMKSIALVLLATLGAACGDDGGNNPIDANQGSDGSGSGSGSDGGMQPVTYVQIEHLARPGIAEALLLSNGYLAGYNATAPTYAGVPANVLGEVVAEAKTVLKAVYLGTCLVNGIAGLDAQNGAKPGGLECAAVGGNLFTNGNPLTGDTLTQAAKDGAQAYADRVFSQFVPDVMRIDTSIDSGYFSGPALCAGAAADKPLLCGGRKLDDDVIDITYFYLLAGAAVPTGLAGTPEGQAQAGALISDGVSFAGAANNPNQGHPAVSTTFPYSAPPI
ncbi:MAG: DUF4331 family protein [Kofleriaceae bacterium]